MKSSRRKLILGISGLFLAILLTLGSSILVYVKYAWFYPVRLSLLMLCFALFGYVLKQKPGNIILTLGTFILLFLLVDTGFSFRGSSHGVEQSLSHQVWHQRHWATNAQGYRDFDSERLTDEPAILCIGDSYTAGYGIKDTANRYSNLLQKHYEDRRVYNLGVPGEGISYQLRTLETFIRPGDVIIWQYFGDDITGDEEVLKELMKDTALVSTFMKAVDPLGHRPVFQQVFIRTSFLLNYLYWNKIHPTLESGLIEMLRRIYEEERYFSIHREQLRSFLTISRQKEASVISLIMPILINEDLSDEIYEERLLDVFLQEEVPVLRVSKLSRPLPLREKVVNKMDAHTNENMHRIIAEELLTALTQLNSASPSPEGR